ncbi:hypothetical protein GOBAR_AA17043 [Gossypium barbadense]|uniref:Uncharacterized protein n=1 Tax=Gossypium barbadense TaxID=3634 RepID=A0A2P5XJV4_GOSBA|nr:hypothetical protein GOBAR_AA17043 [Gossypium barbadense]
MVTFEPVSSTKPPLYRIYCLYPMWLNNMKITLSENPHPTSQSYGLAQIVEKLANRLTPEESLSTTVRGWPSSEYFIKAESGGTRKVRGRTLLRDLYDLDPVERVKVSRNPHGQPVGSEARLLAGYLGILARNGNMLPINYESWHHMPDSNKNQALANIKERFALEVSDDYIKKALDISLKEKLRNVPPGMLRYQWEDAVRFWNSKKGEDRERVGATSRQKQKFTHTAGSRNFASVAEAEEVKSGQKVGRLQLFEITHRKKDGSPMTSEAGEIMV